MFGKDKLIRELKRENLQLKKENMEMVNRVKETRNQIAVCQVDKVMKETMDRMQKYVSEGY